MRIQVLHKPTAVFWANVTNLAMGIAMVVGEAGRSAHITADFSLPSLSISLSLNVLLTLMIVIRLVLHSRDIRAILGAPLGGTSGLYKAIIAMLVESCALFAVSSLLVIGLSVTGHYASNAFLPILDETQVRPLPPRL